MEIIIPIYWQEPKNKIHLRTISKCDLNGDRWTGALAQLVEQWTENPCVPGSIPGGTTRKMKSSSRKTWAFLFYRIPKTQYIFQKLHDTIGFSSMLLLA